MTILGNFLHMSMKKNKRRTLLFIGLVVILLSGMWWSYYAEKNRYCLEVIKLDKDQGYGYTIKQKGNRRLSINRLFLFCHKENHLRLG